LTLEELEASPGWAQVKQALIEKKTGIPVIKDADTKEAFFYWAIRNQAIDELIDLPRVLIDGYNRTY